MIFFLFFSFLSYSSSLCYVYIHIHTCTQHIYYIYVYTSETHPAVFQSPFLLYPSHRASTLILHNSRLFIREFVSRQEKKEE